MKERSARLEKILNWEHWPSSMFYVPNLPYAFYLALKAKHLTFFTAANPSIKSSGNGTESKYTTIQLVPERFRPKSVLATPGSDFSEVLAKIEKENISFPLIAKPDIGFRGLLVQKINTPEALKAYLSRYPINIIIQEFLDYNNECGVFYHRNPNEGSGKITSLTLKKFLTIEGDGISTFQELIQNDTRAKLYANLFSQIHHKQLNNIPKKGETIKLTAIGNHSKGTQFINGNHLISKQLIQTFDKLSKTIEGWYYGRVDIKYNEFSELENGLDFKVLEINGIIAEPTHIYDAENYTYLKALKAIRTHWKSLFEVATTNHNSKKIPYTKPSTFVKEMIDLKQYTKKLKKY